MIFFTFEFLAFFAFVLIFNWVLKPWPLLWRVFLLGASYYFYSVWDLRLLVTLVALSFFNYLIGRAVYSNWGGGKKLFLALGVICDLLVLAFFKYYDFFRVLAGTISKFLGFAIGLPLLEMIVAVGISFYLFKIISFLVDCYRGKIGKYPSLVDFSLYVAFFPQLLSGPIARAEEFLPQLENGGAKKIEGLYFNVTLIMAGLFKKLLIVNYLTTNITDDVFVVPQNHGSLVTLLAILAYALVIYFDLSSYTDMSIGFAGLLGFRTPPNFNSPYASLTIQEFWRKWHITLSNWVRDYIYIPLGGNRKGKVRQAVNLVAAMTAMGFWHGSASHYIFWGVLHGTALGITEFFPKLRDIILSTLPGRLFSWLATFIFVIFSWIFFRVESVSDGFAMIGQLFSFQRLDESFKLYVLIAIIIGFIFLAFEQRIIRAVSGFQQKMPRAVWIAFVTVAVALLFRVGSDTLPAFIYFNF